MAQQRKKGSARKRSKSKGRKRPGAKKRTQGFEVSTIDRLQPDPKNLNRGSDRGDEVILQSIGDHGFARPIFADRNLVVLGGNRTMARARELDMSEIILYRPAATK